MYDMYCDVEQTVKCIVVSSLHSFYNEQCDKISGVAILLESWKSPETSLTTPHPAPPVSTYNKSHFPMMCNRLCPIIAVTSFCGAQLAHPGVPRAPAAVCSGVRCAPGAVCSGCTKSLVMSKLLLYY